MEALKQNNAPLKILGGTMILASLGRLISRKFSIYHIECYSKCNQTIMMLNTIVAYQYLTEQNSYYQQSARKW